MIMFEFTRYLLMRIRKLKNVNDISHIDENLRNLLIKQSYYNEKRKKYERCSLFSIPTTYEN